MNYAVVSGGEVVSPRMSKEEATRYATIANKLALRTGTGKLYRARKRPLNPIDMQEQLKTHALDYFLRKPRKPCFNWDPQMFMIDNLLVFVSKDGAGDVNAVYVIGPDPYDFFCLIYDHDNAAHIFSGCLMGVEGALHNLSWRLMERELVDLKEQFGLTNLSPIITDYVSEQFLLIELIQFSFQNFGFDYAYSVAEAANSYTDMNSYDCRDGYKEPENLGDFLGDCDNAGVPLHKILNEAYS